MAFVEPDSAVGPPSQFEGAAMLPPRSDPRWREFVRGPRKYVLESLSARMLLTRLRLRTMHGDEQAVNEAINTACEFFERNEATTQPDLKAIFGETP